MGLQKSFSAWWLAAIALVIVIAAGGFIMYRGQDRGSLTLVLEPPPVYTGEVYVGGGVVVPGYYPLKAGDTFDDLLNAAGGATGNGPVRMELFSPVAGEAPVQKVNINNAEPWLLCALPGIGKTRAQTIVEYRSKYGRFKDIDELMKVEGIGPVLLDSIRLMVTAGE